MTPAEDVQVLTIRLPQDLYNQLRQAAFDQHTSMNAIAIEAIRKRLDLPRQA
jgi:predicted HicB family RNase H-like nuclease